MTIVLGIFKGKKKRVKPGFVYDGHVLLTAKGVPFQNPLLFIIHMTTVDR